MPSFQERCLPLHVRLVNLGRPHDCGYIPGKTNTLPLEIYFLVQQGREHQAWLWVLVLVSFAISIIGTMNMMNQERYREVD